MMPLITVWNWVSGENNAAHEQALRNACLGVKELGLGDPRGVTVVFVHERGVTHDEEDAAIIIVELLFDKPERTIEARRKLAGALGHAYKEAGETAFQRTRKVEVFVKRFNPDKDGHWKG